MGFRHQKSVAGGLRARVGCGLRSRITRGVAGLAIPAVLSAQTNVSGFVRDSLAGTPLAGAVISLVPKATPWMAGRSTRSDAIGRYAIDTIAPGEYLFGFQHPRLDSLGMDAVTRTLDVTAGVRIMRADLAVPSGRTFVTSLCGASADSSGAVIGRVFDAATGNPLPEGSVVVRWAEMQVGGAGVTRVMRQAVTRFGGDGRYVACRIPIGAPVLVSARAGAGAAAGALGVSSEIELTFPPKGPLIHKNLLVAMRIDAVGASGAGSAAPARTIARSGTARLSGRVTANDGTPVPGARVQVLDTEVSAVTDSSGVFRLTGLPAGTRSVEVTAIGYSPIRTSADLRPDRDVTITVNAGARIATLAAVDVVGAAPDRGGYLKRRAAGVGFFLDGNALEQRGAQNVSQALSAAPSLRPNGFDTQNPTRPNISGRSNCKPTAYLDGQMMRDGLGGIDDLLTIRRVGGIEVYANPTEAPPQFRASGNCAVILVWTRAYVP